MLALFALLASTGLPLTASAPLADTPAPTPSPLQVEIVGGDLETWVALAAAVIGTVAAVASWRASTAARKAAESGERAVEHSAIAANAAQKTAEYERATFEFMVEQQRQAQALGVLVSWGGDFTSPHGSGGVRVTVENASGVRITDLEVWAVKGGQRITEVVHMQDLGSGSQQFDLGGTSDWFESLGSGNAKGVVRFTDAVGLRWERRSGGAPISVNAESPEP